MKKSMGVLLALTLALTLCIASAWADTPAVKIGDTDYSTLSAALAAAENMESAVIDLQGGTFDLTQSSNQHRRYTVQPKGAIDVPDNTTFKNGTFVVSGVTAGQALFYLEGGSATFENVRVQGTGYSSGNAVIHAENGSVTLKNCTFELTNEECTLGGILKGTSLSDSTCIIEKCSFTLTNPTRVFVNLTLTMTDSQMTVTNNDSATKRKTAFRNVKGEIKHSTIDITGCEYGIEFDSDAANLKITDRSEIAFGGSTGKDILVKEGSVTLDGTSTLTYATFDTTTALLVLNLNGGTGTSMVCSKAGSEIDLGDYAPEKSGSEFLGWYDADGGEAEGKISLMEKMEYHARWSGSSGNTSYYYGSTVNEIEAPKTFDPGVAMYGVMAIMSVTGMAYVGKKKF